MVELRKRKLETEATKPSKKASLVQSLRTSSKKLRSAGSKSAAASPHRQGDIINLDGFGGEFDLTDGEKATLSDLVSISIGGVVLFTYPKASTPGCMYCVSPYAVDNQNLIRIRYYTGMSIPG